MKKKLLVTLLGLSALSAQPAFANTANNELAKDAYIYGYSIDEAYKFFYHTAVENDYPLNRFQNIRGLADDTYTAHPTINNDTLHLMGWLDVAAEPVIVSVPDMDEGRYWILHTMDMGHYTNAAFSSRTRGTEGGQFMFAANDWQGGVPDSVDEVIRVDSNLVKLMGRIMALGGEDTKIALDYMDQWTIRTLSEYLGQNGPKPVQRTYPDPKHSTWLERVNFVLCDGTMGDADKQWLEKYQPIGVEACKTDFTPEQLKLAKAAEKQGMQRIIELAPKVSDARQILGTRDTLGDTPREVFAEGTYLGQWGLPPIEASYRKTDFDTKGEKLDGSKHDYVMLFKAPNVSEFWSVTIYGSDNRLMAKNALNRHSRGDRSMKPDADGYYTIHMSSDTKTNANDPNYLPVPEKPFYAIMRFYGADEAIQSGEYQMPEIAPVE
ncbi:DUF1254 domain-containing protein [Vibrio hyugaensis]|uniref:DUF1254 domain-containing protein n=1 Tax=Vibrio hyugaensis TaxID=1534743 RepID=UPI0005F004CD|nr:DUF1254 domain-containing protein [Vibrio hyugaensis]